MNTTALTSTDRTVEEPTFGDETAEFMPWIFGATLLFPITLLSVALWAPALLLLVLIATPFLVLGLLGAVVAIVAMPILFLRDRYERLAERRSAKRRQATSRALTPAEGQQ
jgi:hypothetical protein